MASRKRAHALALKNCTSKSCCTIVLMRDAIVFSLYQARHKARKYEVVCSRRASALTLQHAQVPYKLPNY
eukprot:5476286-Pleurochrysis_carterae.AAC.2